MELSYSELYSALETVKTAFGSDKTGASSILLLNKMSETNLTLAGIATNYQVAKILRPVYLNDDIDFEIIINFKKFNEAVSMAKPSSGIKSSISLNIDTATKELVVIIKKYTAKDNKLVTNIMQRLGFIYVADDRRQGGIKELNIPELFTDVESNTDDTIVWDTTEFISILQKMSIGDASQIIISGKSKAIAVCNSNYCVYKEDDKICLTAVLQSNFAGNIITAFKNCKAPQIIVRKTEHCLVFKNNTSDIALRTEVPLAKLVLINHINGFNSADYAYLGAVLQKDILQDFVKCFTTATGSTKADIKFKCTEGTWIMTFEAPDSTARQNEFTMRVDDMLYDISIANKTFELSIETLIQMLNACDGTKVVFSIAQNEPTTETENVQCLLRLQSLTDDNTTSIRCYSVLE